MNRGAGDEPRLLRHSQFGYTASTAEAMHGEPEAVDLASQERFTQEAREAEEARLRQEWANARERIFGATTEFRAAGVAQPHLSPGTPT